MLAAAAAANNKTSHRGSTRYSPVPRLIFITTQTMQVLFLSRLASEVAEEVTWPVSHGYGMWEPEFKSRVVLTSISGAHLTSLTPAVTSSGLLGVLCELNELL